MARLVREAMQQGAWGLSSQVMMPPGSLASTEEIITMSPLFCSWKMRATSVRTISAN